MVMDAIRKIEKMKGEIEISLLVNNGSINEKELNDMGYEVAKGSFFDKQIIKDGLKFPVHYLSDSRYHLSNGFYFGKTNTFCGFNYIPNFIGQIIAQGFNPDYVRNKEMQDLATSIVGKIEETKRIVTNGNSYLLGNRVRYKGYFVSYDGYSICNFSKDGVAYSAECVGNGKWKLRDTYQVYVTDGVLSPIFSMTDISDSPEWVLGNITKLGRRLTEMDLLSGYTRFRVRTYSDKTLATIKWFDDFESARKYAYDYAVKLAKEVEPRYQRWAHNPPIDWSKRNDYLACYVWYMYNEDYPHLVFVQGEN